MADILLSVGLQTGAAEFSQIQADLNSIMAKIEKSPPKIKVGIEVDETALNVFRKQLSGIVNGISAGKGSPISINISDVGKITSEVGQAKAAIEGVNAAAKSAGDAISNMGAKASEAGTKAASAAKAQESAYKAMAVGSVEQQQALAKANSLLSTMQKNLKSWSAASKGNTSADYQNIEKQATAMRGLISELQRGTISAEDFSAKFARIKSSVDASSAAIKAAGENTSSFVSKMGQLIGKFTQWFSISQIIMAAVRTIKQMISTTIELDSAMTQLQIVTGATDLEMKSFLIEATSLAKELGKSISEVSKSIETFSRLGYTLEESSTLTKFASILSNVAAVDTESATTGLTSIIKGYGMTVEDAEHVADVLIEVGQKYAVSAGEMMEAYERSGAALSATNTSFEKSAGLIAAANAAVQNSSTVGTALKTISARIRKSETELEELGEDTSDLAQGFSKYAKELKALTGVDIMLDEEAGTFKDLYDIFNELAGVWNYLSDTQQARVAEILGGTRQLQVITSILGNWQDAAGAYADAMDSAGVATQANDQYMESIAGHLAVLKASFQELAQSTFTRDLLNQAIDLLNVITNIGTQIAKLVSSFGLVKSALVTIGAIKIFKNLDSSNEFVHYGCKPIAA